MRAAQATAKNAPLDAIEAFALARPPTVDAEIVAHSLHVLATREDEMPIAPTRAYCENAAACEWPIMHDRGGCAINVDAFVSVLLCFFEAAARHLQC